MHRNSRYTCSHVCGDDKTAIGIGCFKHNEDMTIRKQLVFLTKHSYTCGDDRAALCRTSCMDCFQLEPKHVCMQALVHEQLLRSHHSMLLAVQSTDKQENWPRCAEQLTMTRGNKHEATNDATKKEQMKQRKGSKK